MYGRKNVGEKVNVMVEPKRKVLLSTATRENRIGDGLLVIERGGRLREVGRAGVCISPYTRTVATIAGLTRRWLRYGLSLRLNPCVPGRMLDGVEEAIRQ